MAGEHRTHKLAVIVHADVAGSTRMVQRDEHLAHDRIQETFRRFDDFIQRHGGRALELRGDALLAEFERPSDAISAALAFQSAQADYVDMLNDDLRPRVRVGIAMGEVVIADNTVTGAGVVLAQRVEQLAEPGGICITAAIHEALPRRLPFDYESLGEQSLDGFDDGVRVYRVRLAQGQSIAAARHADPARGFGLSALQIGLLAVAVLITTGGAFYWLERGAEQQAPAAADAGKILLPEKQSIAVLPFANMSDDREQEYFADGMTDDLITDLSKIPGLTVIARTSSFAYKGRAEDIRSIAGALGARYIVEGSARRAGDKIRINVQLIDAHSGHHLWADRFDNSRDELFAMQDSIVRQIVKALGTRIDSGSLGRLFSRDPGNLEAYDVFLQGSGIFQRFSREDTFLARQYFERAIALDPEFSRAYAMLAWTHVFEYTNGWSQQPDDTLQRALELARKSIALDSRSPIAHFVKGLVHRERREFDQALVEAERAIRIEPSYANGYVLTATLLYYAGKPQEGLDMLGVASRLNPLHPSNYPFHKGQALFILGRYDEAVDAFNFGLSQNPTSQRLRVWLAATYAQMGLIDEANWEAEQILSEDPDFSPASLESIFPFQNPADLRRFNLALSKAGFRDLAER